jgi:hypothetical protein
MGSAKSRLVAVDDRAALQMDWIESMIARKVAVTGQSVGGPIGKGDWVHTLNLEGGAHAAIRGSGRRFKVSSEALDDSELRARVPPSRVRTGFAPQPVFNGPFVD